MATVGWRGARPKRTEPDKTGHGGAPGPAPFGAIWRDERDLCVRRDGSLDDTALKRWYRARKNREVWVRESETGMLQLACDATDRDRPLRVGESAAFGGADPHDAAVQRHLELEKRLRTCPHLTSSSDHLPCVYFPLSRVEWNELRGLRAAHGFGEELGGGELRIYWRPDCDDNVVGAGRRVLPKLLMRGRALA
jgi:hypothetical protein